MNPHFFHKRMDDKASNFIYLYQYMYIMRELLTDSIFYLTFNTRIHHTIWDHNDLHVFNSLRPSDAYMRHQPRPSLVQIMACCLIVAKPLPEPMLVYCQIGSLGTNKLQSDCIQNSNIFIQENAFKNVGKCRSFCLDLNVLSNPSI